MISALTWAISTALWKAYATHIVHSFSLSPWWLPPNFSLSLYTFSLSFWLYWENKKNQRKYSKAFITVSMNRPISESLSSASSPIMLDQLSLSLQKAVCPLGTVFPNFLHSQGQFSRNSFLSLVSSFIFLSTNPLQEKWCYFTWLYKSSDFLLSYSSSSSFAVFSC